MRRPAFGFAITAMATRSKAGVTRKAADEFSSTAQAFG